MYNKALTSYLPIQHFQLLRPARKELIIPSGRSRLLPLRSCFVQISDHAIELLDGSHVFAVALNGGHD